MVTEFVKLAVSVDEATAKTQKSERWRWTAGQAGKTLWLNTRNGLDPERTESAKAYLRLYGENLAKAGIGRKLEETWASSDISVIRAWSGEPTDDLEQRLTREQAPTEELSWAFAGLAAMSHDDSDGASLQVAALAQLLMTRMLGATLAVAPVQDRSDSWAGDLLEVTSALERSTESLWWACESSGLSLESKLQIQRNLLRIGEPEWARLLARIMKSRFASRMAGEPVGEAGAAGSAPSMVTAGDAILRALVDSDEIPAMSKAWDQIESVQTERLAAVGAKGDGLRLSRKIFERYRAMRAEWSGLILVLGARSFKDLYGHFPDDLAALRRAGLGDIRSEASSGQPVRMIRDSKRFLLYSVGADGIDDGGKCPDANFTPWAAFLRQTAEDRVDRVWIDER